MSNDPQQHQRTSTKILATVTPVGAAAPGGGTFGSGGVCTLGAGAATGVAGDSPAEVYRGTSLWEASQMETRSVGGGSVGWRLRALATARGADKSSCEPPLRSTVALSGSGGDAMPSRGNWAGQGEVPLDDLAWRWVKNRTINWFAFLRTIARSG